MQLYIWIAIGSALGGMSRYFCSGLTARLIGETFPWGSSSSTLPDLSSSVYLQLLQARMEDST